MIALKPTSVEGARGGRCPSFGEFLLRTCSLVRRKAGLFVSIIACCVGLSILDSLLLPRYVSEGVIVVPALRDSSRYPTRAVGLEINEQFLETQRTILRSDDVLRWALVEIEKRDRIEEGEVAALRGALRVHRMPFSAAFRLEVSLPHPGLAENLLEAIIDVYSLMFQASLVDGPRKTRDELRAKVAALESELAEAEAERRSLAALEHERLRELLGILGELGTGEIEAGDLGELARIVSIAVGALPLDRRLETARRAHELTLDRMLESEAVIAELQGLSVVEAASPTPAAQTNSLLGNVGKSSLFGVLLCLVVLYALSRGLQQRRPDAS